MANIPNTVMYEAMLGDVPSPYLFYKMSCLYANTDKNVFLKLCLRCSLISDEWAAAAAGDAAVCKA